MLLRWSEGIRIRDASTQQVKTGDEIQNLGVVLIFICGQIEIPFYAYTVKTNFKHCKLHTITLSHRHHSAVWCSFIFFVHTKNRAFIKTGCLSYCWMLTKSAGFREDRTGACGCCVWWPVWGCVASFPATTLWNILWSRAGVERNRRPYTATLTECLLRCLIFGHSKIYTSDFFVLHVD